MQYGLGVVACSFFIQILFITSVYGQNEFCEAFQAIQSAAPACPEGTGQMILSETYPAGAFVFSDTGGETYLRELIRSVVRSYEAGAPMPALVFLGEPHRAALMRNILGEEVSKHFIGEERSLAAAQWQKQVVHVRTNAMIRVNWNQDYFQSVASTSTGLPVFREVEGYFGDSRNPSRDISNALAACGVTQGRRIGSLGWTESGYYGGNLEAAPGLCIVGSDHLESNQLTDLKEQICGGQASVVAPTDFLNVGHTDEIFKTIPNGGSPPCNFDFLISSPETALQELKKAPDQPFIEIPEAGFSYDEARNITASDLFSMGSYNEFCSEHIRLTGSGANSNDDSSGREESPPPRRKKGVSSLFDLFERAWAQNGNAGDQTQSGGKSLRARIEQLIKQVGGVENLPYILEKYYLNLDSPEIREVDVRTALEEVEQASLALLTESEIKKCKAMTNAEAREVFLRGQINGVPIKDFYDAVTDRLQVFRQEVESKLRQKFPQCNPKWIEVPQLFWGEPGTEKDDILKYAYATNLLPAPSNAVSLGQSLIFSDTYNSAFNDYLKKAVEGRSEAQFVNAFHAQIMGGNLHCSTQAIRVCRPSKNREEAR